MDKRLERVLPRLSRFAAEPDDTEAVRLRKTIGITIVISAIPTYFAYGIAYLAFDERPAGFISLAGGSLFAIALLSYGVFRQYAAHWFFLVATLTVALMAVHFTLGGFASSGMVILWVLVGPLVTIVADSPRNGLRWAIVVALSVIAAAVVDPYVPAGNKLPQAMITTLSALNLLGFASYMLLAVFYYVWRIDVIGKLVTAEREARMREIEKASRHKSEFLANMSHELRTPLNAILGFSEMLAERLFGDLNSKQEEYVRDIHESGKHLLSLINDILDLSKIEAGKMELELSEFDVPSALRDAITLVKERAQRHGIALRLEIDPGLGSLHADERKFQQIMLNMLSNAVKFTPDGGSIHVCAKPNGAAVEIFVSDTGAGIAPEDQAAVFEEFKQVGKDSTRKAEGTGLGLPLTKRFIELHGGTIRLESAPGKGSTFGFTLPIRQGG